MQDVSDAISFQFFCDHIDNKEIKNPYLENKKDIKTISFSANGNVLNGNIYKNKITDIINNYEPK